MSASLGRNSVVLIRADASPLIGSGHVMRCLALACAICARGGRPVFVTYQIPAALRRRVESSGSMVQEIAAPHPDPRDLQALLQIAREMDAKWVVTDGYAFETAYQQAIRRAGFRLMVIDDYNHLPRYECDVLLNPNLGAESLRYTLGAGTGCLFGPRYALLRPEFQSFRNWKRTIPDRARRILISLGGADRKNVTATLIQGIGGLEMEIDAVAGCLNSNIAELNRLAETMLRESPVSQIRIRSDVQRMAELMANADLAILSASTTCWEACFMGLPMLVTVIADNQHNVALALRHSGVGVVLGEGQQLTPADVRQAVQRLAEDAVSRRQFSEAGRALVDGAGAERVAGALGFE